MAINERATIDLSVNSKEAQDELRKLQGEAEDLRRRIDAAMQAGDSKGTKKLQASLRQVNRDMKKAERAAFDFDKVLRNLSGASFNDINRTVKELTRRMNAIPRTAKSWSLYNEQIKRCQKELGLLNKEARKSEGLLSRANNAFNKWGAGIAASVAAVTGLQMTISKMRDMAKEKEDSQAQLQALTGLDDDSIAWLTAQAEQLSTSMADGGLRIRQSATEILKAYQLVGGAKPELLEDKEALNAVTVETMRLAAASGMDLTEAVDGVTLAMNQYGATAEEVGRYVNTLAAGAKFGSAEVANVTTAVRKAGVAASTAGIPIETLVGAIEMLAERGIKDEVAGTGLKTFFIKLEAMADDCRPSVVGLQAALDNLRAKELDATDVQRMFGLETYTVAQAMIDGAEKVDHYTKAVTGTAAAVEQAAVNSDTAAARAAQAGNKMREMGAELGTRLTPLVTAGAKAATVMMQALVGLLDILARHKATVIAATAAVVAYNVALKANDIRAKAAAAATGLLSKAMRTLRSWLVAVRSGFTLLNKTMVKNVIGLVAAALAALAVKIYETVTATRQAAEEFRKMQAAVADATRKAAADVRDEQQQVVRLFDAARDLTLSYEQRQAAIEQLHAINAGYLGDLTAENVLTQQGIDLANRYIKLLGIQSRAKAAQQGMADTFAKVQEELTKTYAGSGVAQEYGIVNADQFLNPQTQEQSTTSFRLRGAVQELRQLWDNYREFNTMLDDLTRQQLKIEGEVIKQSQDKATKAKKKSATDTEATTGGAAAAATTTEEEYYRRQEAVIDDYLKSRQTAERLAYLRREHDLGEHNRRMMQLELDAIRAKQALYEAGGTVTGTDRWNELEVQAIPVQQSLDAARLEGFAATLDDTATADAVQRNIELNRLAFDALERMYDNDLVTYRQYLAMKAEIEAGNLDAAMGIRQEKSEEQKRWEDMDTDERVAKAAKAANMAWEAISPLFQASSQLVQANLAAEEAKINERYDAEIKAAEGNDARIKQLEEQRDAELAKARTEANKKAMAIQIAQAMATTAVGIINAWASAMQMPPVIAPIYGAAMTALMAAQAAIQIAAIKRQQQAQAAGYLAGGYTRRDPDDRREAGVVHANEFVATAAAVRNPAVRPMLDLIDRAQRQGIVAALTPSDIAAAAGARLAYAPAAPATAPVTAKAAAGGSLDGKMLDTLRKIDRRMDRPLAAYTYVTGKGGSQQAQRLHDRMEANARRRAR